MLLNDKLVFDCYDYYVNSAQTKEIMVLYILECLGALSHFHIRKCFHSYARSGWTSVTALGGAQ